MSEENKRSLDLNLTLPSSLWILKILVVILSVTTGYEGAQILLVFPILMGACLAFQVGRRFMAGWRINQANIQVQAIRAEPGEFFKMTAPGAKQCSKTAATGSCTPLNT